MVDITKIYNETCNAFYKGAVFKLGESNLNITAGAYNVMKGMDIAQYFMVEPQDQWRDFGGEWYEKVDKRR